MQQAMKLAEEFGAQQREATTTDRLYGLKIAIQSIRGDLLNPNIPDTKKSSVFSDAADLLDYSAGLGLVSLQGMKASAFPVTPNEMKAAGVHYTSGALRHVFMQADRALNILNQPTSYTPRKTPLYNGKAEEGWKPLIP